MTTELSDRQNQIITVSLEIISESGIQGLTIKNLAKKIGFSESAIYRHYENKIQILIAILNYFKENSANLFNNVQSLETDAISKIEHLFLNLFKTFTNSPSLVAVIFSEELFRNETVLLEKVAEVMKNNAKSLTQIIKIGQENNEIRKDITAAHFSIIILGSLRMFVKNWHMTNYSVDLTESGTEFINSIKTLIKN
ncbi:MAG: TetR/AcrR family transcriptional regulator [Bacteroidales bacterium]|nr:TetR/AcrR family transcriptional regulator [Bacteroidales bacterium]MBN2756674.1 TetR/AcrR family transcriptional regulator [Bacteroidales bacterium]